MDQRIRRRLTPDPADWMGWRIAAAASPVQAQRWMRRAALLAPDVPDLWVDLARLVLMGRDVAAAGRAVRRALVLDPAMPQAYVARHSVESRRLGDHAPHPSRTRTARQAVQAGAGHPEVLAMIGRLAYQRGEYARAAAAFSAALKGRWNRGWLWSLALAVMRLDRSDQTAGFLRRLRRRQDARDLAALVRGCVAARRGRALVALRHVDRAVAGAGAAFPDGPAALPRVGEVERALGGTPASPAGGTPSRQIGETVLMTSGDARYLEAFLDGFVGSARQRAPGMPLHVHAIGPVPPALDARIRAAADRWTHDRGEVGMDRAYLTVSRFLALPAVRRSWARPILTVDIDTVIAADPRPILATLADADVACRMDDHILPWERAQVTALYTASGAAADAVVAWYAALIRGRLAAGKLAYYADQGLLWGLIEHLRRVGYPARFADLALEPWLTAARQAGIEAKTRELADGD